MSNTTEEISREKVYSQEIQDIIGTKVSGQARRIVIEPHKLFNWQAITRYHLKKLGYKLRYRYDRKTSTVKAWAE